MDVPDLEVIINFIPIEFRLLFASRGAKFLRVTNFKPLNLCEIKRKRIWEFCIQMFLILFDRE